MQFIHLFNFFLILISSYSHADEVLNKRLSLFPPSSEDYAPILETVDNELSALRLKNFGNAYFTYTSKDFRKKTSLPQFTNFIKANPALFNNKSISLTAIQINNNIAYYTGNIISNEGVLKSLSIQLIFEDDEWKILGIQLNP
jgi:hypothetical protein